MKVETASPSAIPISAAANTAKTVSTDKFEKLLEDLDISIKKKESDEDPKAKEERIRLETLSTLIEALTGEKLAISKDDIVSISGTGNSSMEVTLSNEGFENLKNSLRKLQKKPPETNIDVSSSIIKISGKQKSGTASSVSVIPSKESSAPKVLRPVDPIVVSLGKNTASLGEGTISFDIDGDGSKNTISRLGLNDFLLAVDKNNNGLIDNGAELFGPLSGNGYQELRLLDLNKDNKIDNSDPDFGSLKLMEFSMHNKQAIHSLISKGVEAIYLAASKISVDLFDSSGIKRAQISETSGLKLSGDRTGTVQHLDFFS